MNLLELLTFTCILNGAFSTIVSHNSHAKNHAAAELEVVVKPDWSARSTAKVKDASINVNNMNESVVKDIEGFRVDYRAKSNIDVHLNASIVKTGNRSVSINFSPPLLRVDEDLDGQLVLQFFGPAPVGDRLLLRLEVPFLYRSEPEVGGVVVPNFTVSAGGLHVQMEGKNLDIAANQEIYLLAEDFTSSCKEKCKVVKPDFLLCKTPNLLQPPCNVSYYNQLLYSKLPTTASNPNPLVGQSLSIKLSDNIIQPIFAPLTIVNDPSFENTASEAVTPDGGREFFFKGDFPAWKHMVSEDVRIEVGGVTCPRVKRDSRAVYSCSLDRISYSSAKNSNILIHYGNLKFDHVKPLRTFFLHPIVIVMSSVLLVAFLVAMVTGVAVCCHNDKKRRKASAGRADADDNGELLGPKQKPEPAL